MRGHIKQRSKGSWSLIIDLDKTPDGRRKQKWFTVKGTRKQAEQRLTELLRQIDTGIYIEPDKQKVSEYLTKWLADYVNPNCSPKTAEGYEIIVNRHLVPAIGRHTISGLKPEHLQHYYSVKLKDGLSAQTIRHHHTVLHKALQCAVEWQILTRNIADAAKPPRAKRIEMQTWNEYEIKEFLEAAKETQYYELFYLALFSGMRRSELLALRWQDIDFIFGQVSVNRGLHVLPGGKVIFRQPKTAAGRRVIALPPSALLVLSEYREKKEAECLMIGTSLSDRDLVFSTLGKPLLSNTVSHAWSKIVKRSGIKPIRLHDSRHTHASIMLRQGVHPKIVQERLGHSSITITLDIYSHVTPGLQEAAALKFDDAFNLSDNRTDNSVSKMLANPELKVV